MTQPIKGFSKLSKEQKIAWIGENYTENAQNTKEILRQYWNNDPQLQQLHDEFIENTISNYYLPFGIAPNFLINESLYAIPMAIEESSVVAAASKAAKFWLDRGGFKAEVIGTEKVGQVHFIYTGDSDNLFRFIGKIMPSFYVEAKAITEKMEARGGGISCIELKDKTDLLPNYYQLHCTFETLDAMGANFINSCLEQFATTLKAKADQDGFLQEGDKLEIAMSILSNYVPNCLVRAEVSCLVSDLSLDAQIPPEKCAEKIVRAVGIANVEPYRAVTHNKGIMNGVDAVILATGNDFRAVEAGVHAFAAKDGGYKSLTNASIEDGVFRFWIEIPLALGTVGGLTSLHPMVQLAHEILQYPSAKQLMEIVAVAGLAQNFAALSSLVTTGIQEGHMKMHLLNILNQMKATKEEKTTLVSYFKNNTATHSAVVEALDKLRENL